jgi:hypothetical protein
MGPYCRSAQWSVRQMPLESSVSYATIWSINLELSITILKVLFTLIYDVYSTGIIYDRQLTIVICL